MWRHASLCLPARSWATESPLTVTQMLWVNLIRILLPRWHGVAPPSETVMRDKPRDRRAFIINRAMRRDILGVGFAFFFILLGLLYVFEHSQVTALTDFLHLHIGEREQLSAYELSLFFTIFVMLQFWNMFNARAFGTDRSALNLRGCSGFLIIALSILVGQVVIVTFGGEFFSVVPLSLSDWLWLSAATSLVLWVGEESRVLRRRR